MAADRDAGVDPRFDPLFQRGYDPTVHSSSRRDRAAAPAPVRPGEWASAAAPAAPAEPETAGRVVPETGVAQRVVAEREVAEREVSQPEPAEQDKVNPFRLALLLASVGAIGGAALMLWRKIEEDVGTFASAYDVEELFAEQFTDALLVPLLAGGLIGLSLWLALGALPRPRRD